MTPPTGNSSSMPDQASVPAQLLLLWRRFTIRHWRRAPGSTLLLLVLLALGVGMVLSIRLANRAAVAGFAIFTESVTGESDFVLTPRAGNLPDSILPDVRQALGDAPVFVLPVLEISASIAAPEAAASASGTAGFAKGPSLTLIGVDLIAVQNLAYTDAFAERGTWIRRATDTDADDARDDLWTYLNDPHAVYISQALADQRGLAQGDRLPLILHDQPIDFRIVGVIPDTPDGLQAPADLAIMDLAALQQVADVPGRLDRVELRLEDGPLMADRRATVRQRLDAMDDARFSIETPDSRRETGETMTRAFRMNLTVLSLLALIVGLYLIMQALEGAVAKRRGEIAVMRSLGFEPRVIQAAWMLEAFTLGVVGSALGVVLGIAVAQLTVQAVAQTVNALYFQTTVDAADWHGGEVAVAMALGISASLLAGWVPARDAANTPPAQMLASGGRSPGPALFRRPLLGVILIAIGCGLAMLPPIRFDGATRFPLAGHLAGFAWIVGATSIGGLLFPALGRFLTRISGGWPALRVAGSQFRRVTGRHRLTVAGLLLAIGMAMGMATLVHSFERTIDTWIGSVLRADLYVFNRQTTGPSSGGRLSDATIQRLQAEPEVAGMDCFQVFTIDYGGGRVSLAGAALAPVDERRHLIWVQAPDDPDIVIRGIQPGEVLASESFSERFDIDRGDRVTVPSPAGEQELQVIGVYADYGNERGTLMVDLPSLHAWFADDQVVSASVYLRPGTDADAVAARLERDYPGLGVRGNRVLRAEILRIFHQTFAITYALEGLAVLVAVAGLGLALASLLMERRRETHTLRELGMDRRQIATATALEGLGVTTVGLAVGLVLSLALGALLIYVINKQSFGWTLAYVPPWDQIAVLSVVILAVGGSVAWCVGYWGAVLPTEQEE